MCSSSCPPSTYQSDFTPTCLPCGLGCLSCYKDLCYRCDISNRYYMLDNGVCERICSPYKYFSQKSGKCEWKSPFCNSYTQGSEQQCNSCNFFMPIPTLNQGVCNWTCPLGSVIGPSLTCEPCPANCLECFGVSNGGCIKCLPGFVLKNSICSNSCGTGFTPNPSGQCIRCPVGCLSCNSVGACFSCSSGLTLYNSQCLSSCVFNTTLGSFYNGSVCTNCSSSCVTCVNSSTCIRCASAQPYLDSTRTCRNTCSMGEYADNTTFLCQPCPPTCLTCSSPSNCYSCTFQSYGYLYYLYRGSCYSSCPNGTYADYESQQCQQCSPNCLTCYGAQSTQCLTCQPGSMMNINQCVKECPIRKYLDQSYHCDSCFPLCLTCWGPASFQCLICSEANFLYRHSCYKVCP